MPYIKLHNPSLINEREIIFNLYLLIDKEFIIEIEGEGKI